MLRLCSVLAIILLLTTFPADARSWSSPSSIIADGLSATAHSAAQGCFVDLRGSLIVDGARPHHKVEVHVDALCNLSVRDDRSASSPATAGSRLARPVAANTRGCLGDNTTYVWDGSSVSVAELLRDEIHFDWDRSNLASYFYWSTATASGFPYSTPGQTSSGDSWWVFPAPSHVVDTWASWYNWFGWVADKENWLYGYGNGQCSLTYRHSGYVPTNGWVTAELTYWPS